MKLPVNTKLKPVLAKQEDGRFAAHCAAIRDGNLIVTDRQILVIHRGASPDTPDCLLDAETVAAIDKNKGQADIGEMTTRIRNVQYDHSEHTTYITTWNKVRPDQGGHDICVTLNAALLLKLAKAMGSEGDIVRLYINEQSPTQAIRIESPTDGSGEGVIMTIAPPKATS